MSVIQPNETASRSCATGFANAHHIIYDEGDYPRCLEAGLNLAEYEIVKAIARRPLRGETPRARISMYVRNYGGRAVRNGANRFASPTERFFFSVRLCRSGKGRRRRSGKLVAEELGIAMEQVAIRQGDTDEVPDAVGTFRQPRRGSGRSRGANGGT